MCPTTTRAGNTFPAGLVGIGPAKKWTVLVSEDRWGGVKGKEGEEGGGGRLGVWCHSGNLVLQPSCPWLLKERAEYNSNPPLPLCDSVLWQKWLRLSGPPPFPPCYSNSSLSFFATLPCIIWKWTEENLLLQLLCDPEFFPRQKWLSWFFPLQWSSNGCFTCRGLSELILNEAVLCNPCIHSVQSWKESMQYSVIKFPPHYLYNIFLHPL